MFKSSVTYNPSFFLNRDFLSFVYLLNILKRSNDGTLKNPMFRRFT